MRILPLLVLLIATDADAFTEPDSGGWVGASAGLALDSHTPFSAGPEWEATAGLWFGKHDPAYAFGKYTGVGLTLSQAYLRGDLVTEPLLELRTGADIVVVTTQLFVSGGPQFRAGQVGATMLVGGGIKYRMTPYFGITARLEAGASVLGGSWGFRSNVVLGVEFASPWSGSRE